jgi:cytochrome c-type biogenesis protein CcmH/NrfF
MTGLSSLATVMATLCSQCVLKMAVSIQSPTKCEVRAVIRFLYAKGETAAEIHRQLVSLYGEDIVMGRCYTTNGFLPTSYPR